MNNRFLFISLLFFGMLGFVSANPYWNGTPWDTTNYFTENATDFSNYNFSLYVANASDSNYLRFEFGAGSNITSNIYGSKIPSFFSWINLNSGSGILSFNSSTDNQTGSYAIPVDVYYNNSGTESSIGANTFNFIINATNDAQLY